MNDYIMPDTGCEYSPTCLACKRAVCKEDEPRQWRQDRNAEIVRLVRLGCREEARQRYGISSRTVLRIMQEGA